MPWEFWEGKETDQNKSQCRVTGTWWHMRYEEWASESCSVMSDSLRPHGLYKPWNSPGQNTGEGSHSLLQGLFPTQESNPGLSQRISDSLPAKPQGKPKNIGVGSLSLLQRIFLTQESNQGLLHCRQILYQLSYQGSWKSGLGKMKVSWYLTRWSWKIKETSDAEANFFKKLLNIKVT